MFSHLMRWKVKLSDKGEERNKRISEMEDDFIWISDCEVEHSSDEEWLAVEGELLVESNVNPTVRKVETRAQKSIRLKA